MSTTLSEVQNVLKTEGDKLKHEEHPSKLNRTSSMEKIMLFNSYIYTHHYYIIPALLNWLKTSQSGLQNAAEKTIFLFRSLFYNSLVYKLFHVNYEAAKIYSTSCLVHIKSETIPNLIANLRAILTNTLESTFLFKMCIYFSVAFIISELILCIYLLCITYLPIGLVFLVVSLLYIHLLCYKSLVYQKNPDAKKHK